MPELPEVEGIRHRLANALVGKAFSSIDTQQDDVVFQTARTEFVANLLGKVVKGAHRHGKYFWLELASPEPSPGSASNSPVAEHRTSTIRRKSSASSIESSAPTKLWALFHLGMTGWVKLKSSAGKVDTDYDWVEVEEAPPMLADDPTRAATAPLTASPASTLSSPARTTSVASIASPLQKQVKREGEDWPPPHWKALFRMEDNTEWAFTDIRRLGRIQLLEGDNPRELQPLSKLGFDALTEVPDAEAFAAALRRRKLPVKNLLLDQSFSCGIGNWIADEVLYQAKVHPMRRTDSLTDEEVESIRNYISTITQKAVECRIAQQPFPATWLFHKRWGKVASKKETLFTFDGHKIKFITLGGRTAAVVPWVQKESGTSAKSKETKKRKRNEIDEEEDDESSDDDSDFIKTPTRKPKKLPAKVEEKEKASKPTKKSPSKAKTPKKEDVMDDSSESSDSEFLSANPKRKSKQKHTPEPRAKTSPVKTPSAKRRKSNDGTPTHVDH